MLASETRVGYSSSVMSTDQRAFSVAVAAAAAAAFACGAAAGIWYTRKHYATKPQHSLRLNLDRIVPSTPGNLSPTASVLSVPQTPRETPRRSSSMDSSAFSRSSSLNGGLGAGSDKFKMVMVVRKDLGWNRQKTTVMCAHICLAMFKKLYKGRHPYLTAWENVKGPKVILRVEDEEQLMAVYDAAKSAELPTHRMVESMGDPSDPHRTVSILAVGPAPSEAINKITAEYPLL
eukprot:jgi/Chrzof1/1936/Cz10g27030.t1